MQHTLNSGQSEQACNIFNQSEAKPTSIVMRYDRFSRTAVAFVFLLRVLIGSLCYLLPARCTNYFMAVIILKNVKNYCIFLVKLILALHSHCSIKLDKQGKQTCGSFLEDFQMKEKISVGYSYIIISGMILISERTSLKSKIMTIFFSLYGPIV